MGHHQIRNKGSNQQKEKTFHGNDVKFVIHTYKVLNPKYIRSPSIKEKKDKRRRMREVEGRERKGKEGKKGEERNRNIFLNGPRRCRHFPRVDIKMANRNSRRSSTLFLLREVETKTTTQLVITCVAPTPSCTCDNLTWAGITVIQGATDKFW